MAKTAPGGQEMAVGGVVGRAGGGFLVFFNGTKSQVKKSPFLRLATACGLRRDARGDSFSRNKARTDGDLEGETGGWGQLVAKSHRPPQIVGISLETGCFTKKFRLRQRS